MVVYILSALCERPVQSRVHCCRFNIGGAQIVDAGTLHNFVGSDLSGSGLVVIPDVIEEDSTGGETVKCIHHALQGDKKVAADIVCTRAGPHVHGITIALAGRRSCFFGTCDAIAFAGWF